MAEHYLAHVGGPAVAAAQSKFYGRVGVSAERAPASDFLGMNEIEFIAERDSFYLASITETGWPYVQHRGGPAGFLRVLSPQRLAFADIRGNRQMLTTGNLAVNDRVSLFLMDYPRRERLKILGRARVLAAAENTDLARRIEPPEWSGKAERVFVIDVVSFDWNCPKQITPRYTLAEVEKLTAPLRARIQELETELGRR